MEILPTSINNQYPEYAIKNNSKVIDDVNPIKDSVQLSFNDATKLQIIQARIKTQYYNNPENIDNIVNAIFYCL